MTPYTPGVTFPVHSDLGRRSKLLRQTIPWALIAPHEPRVLANHGQTLQRLAERGGLCSRELWCVFHDKRLREMVDEATAEAWLEKLA